MHALATTWMLSISNVILCILQLATYRYPSGAAAVFWEAMVGEGVKQGWKCFVYCCPEGDKKCQSAHDKRVFVRYVTVSFINTSICTQYFTIHTGIKPGRGTNRNENLHRNINAIMKASRCVQYVYHSMSCVSANKIAYYYCRSRVSCMVIYCIMSFNIVYLTALHRYGVELAYALLTTCFFQHNAKQLAHSDESRPRYVEELFTECQEHATQEQFGLSFETPSNASPAAQDGSAKAIDIMKASYAEILKHFTVSYS